MEGAAKKVIGELSTEDPAIDGAAIDPAIDPARPKFKKFNSFASQSKAWTTFSEVLGNDTYCRRVKAGCLLVGVGVAGILGANALLHHLNIYRPTESKMADLFAIKRGMEAARKEKQSEEEDPAKEEVLAINEELELPINEELELPTKDPYKEASDYIMSEFEDLYSTRGALLAIRKKVFTCKMPDLNTPLPSGQEYFGEPF